MFKWIVSDTKQYLEPSNYVQNVIKKYFTYHIYLIYKNKEDLALNNLQGLIFNKAKPNVILPIRVQSKDQMDLLKDYSCSIKIFDGI